MNETTQNPNPRITRTNYAIFYILTTGIMIALLNAISAPEPSRLFFFLLVEAGIKIYLAQRRLKDIDWNPWLAVLVILPFVGFIYMFPKGTQGTNQWGEDPRQKKGAK